MRSLLCVGLALVLAGCGVLDEKEPAAPRPPDPAVVGPSKPVRPIEPSVPAPRLLPVSAAVALALDQKGGVAIVGLDGSVTIKPASLETAADVVVDGLQWSSWTVDGAVARGVMHVQTCNPTCANGGVRDAAVRVTLSDAKVCHGRRYFGGGSVVLDDAGSPPATYLRAPC